MTTSNSLTVRPAPMSCWIATGNIRPFVRGIVERFRSQTPAISQSEIHPLARLKTVGSI
jgi:flagellar biosynthesis protein FlhA